MTSSDTPEHTRPLIQIYPHCNNQIRKLHHLHYHSSHSQNQSSVLGWQSELPTSLRRRLQIEASPQIERRGTPSPGYVTHRSMPHPFIPNPYLSMPIQSACGDRPLEPLAEKETRPHPALLRLCINLQWFGKSESWTFPAANIMSTSCQHHANIMPTVPKPEKECWKRPEETGAKTGHDGMMIMMQKRKRQSARTANVPWLT